MSSSSAHIHSLTHPAGAYGVESALSATPMAKLRDRSLWVRPGRDFMEESLTFKGCSSRQKTSFHPALLTSLPFPHSGGQKMCHTDPPPHQSCKTCSRHAVPGSDFLIQLRFSCHTFLGTNDNLSRAQEWLAPHLLTVGKHNCQRTEHWERLECLGGKKI